MKTLLVPIDHTATAEHTLAYANKLAVRWPAEIVVLYCHPTAANATAKAEAGTLATQEQRLRSLVERLRYQQLTRQDGRRIRYRYRVLSGCLHDHVRAEAIRCAADLVVMGLEHIDCDRQEAPGNHAAAITELVRCPVLVVPTGRRPLPNRLVFSANFGAVSQLVLPQLAALAGAFPAPLELVEFYAPSQRPQRRSLRQGLSKAVTHLNWAAPVTSHLIEEDAPLEGTSEFCARLQTQLLIIAPTSHAQLLRYFDACYATTQAYHTQIPVLVLPAERTAQVACCERCAGHPAQPATPTAPTGYASVRWV